MPITNAGVAAAQLSSSSIWNDLHAIDRHTVYISRSQVKHIRSPHVDRGSSKERRGECGCGGWMLVLGGGGGGVGGGGSEGEELRIMLAPCPPPCLLLPAPSMVEVLL